MLDARILQLVRLLGGCNDASHLEWLCCDAGATARNVSRTASGGHAEVATTFFGLSVRLVPRARRATMKSGDRDLKRATRACGFGLERLPWPGDGLFASACLDCYLARSARDSRAAAQIKLCLKYDVRKNFAETRLRVKGRFVKKEEEDLLKDLVGVV